MTRIGSIVLRVVVHAGFAASLASTVLAQEESAPRHEVGLTLGSLLATDRSSRQAPLELSSGIALQANYGFKLWEWKRAALYGEVHFLANPQRLVASRDQTLTRDVATLFATPGIRVKFFPRAALSPYVAAGGGYALYEQSLTRLDGQPNAAPRTIGRGAVDFGGGFDLKFWSFVALRAEIRDFYTGSPGYNAPLLGGGQHNIVAGGGIVLQLRQAKRISHTPQDSTVVSFAKNDPLWHGMLQTARSPFYPAPLKRSEWFLARSVEPKENKRVPKGCRHGYQTECGGP